MNNFCIYWFFTHILLGILNFKGLTAQRLYKSFGVKGSIISSPLSLIAGLSDVQLVSHPFKQKEIRFLNGNW
jgi:hypothetical protein